MNNFLLFNKSLKAKLFENVIRAIFWGSEELYLYIIKNMFWSYRLLVKYRRNKLYCKMEREIEKERERDRERERERERRYIYIYIERERIEREREREGREIYIERE